MSDSPLPQKQQKTQEHFNVSYEEKCKILEYQNASLSAKLKDQRDRLEKLQKLTKENEENQALITKVNANWHKLLSDIKSVCETYSPNSLSESSPYTLMVEQDKGVESLNTLTQTYFKTLVSLLQNPYSSHDELAKKLTLTSEDLVRTKAQLSTLKAHEEELQDQVNRLQGSVSSLVQENENLVLTKENLNLRLAHFSQAKECLCPCNCGARKHSQELPEITQLKQELQALKKQRDEYKAQAEEQTQKSVQLTYELQVSEERLIRTRAFKSIINQSRTLLKQTEATKKKNEELEKSNQEFTEQKQKEIKDLMHKEEEKRKTLSNKVESLQRSLARLEREKEELELNYNKLSRKERLENKSKHSKQIIQDLEQERQYLKKKVESLLKEKKELSEQNDTDTQRILELEDQLHLANLNKPQEETLPSEEDLDSQLRKYRNEVKELRSQTKAKDRLINRKEEELKHLKSKYDKEKRSNEDLISEIDFLGNSYDKEKEHLRKVQEEYRELEETNFSLKKEMDTQNTLKKLHDEERKLYEEKIVAKEQVAAELKTLVHEEQKRSAQLERTLESMESKLQTQEHKLQQFCELNSDKLREHQEMLNFKKEVQNKIQESQKLSMKHATQALQYKLQYQEATQEVSELKKQLKKDTELSKLYPSEERLLSEISRLRKLVRCPLCETRHRDTVLVSCCHTFCRKCLEANLKHHDESCPTCMMRFQYEHLKPLFFR